jgi:hypothetical protein
MNGLVHRITLAASIVPSLLLAQSRGAALHINDPATADGYAVTTFNAPNLIVPDISVLGVYETRSDHSFDYHPQGAATVHVRYNGSKLMDPLILVLSAYEPTLWNIDAQAGTRISEIVLNGFNSQQVANSGSIPIVNKSGASSITACSYAWPGDNQGCNTQGLVQGAQALVGAPLTAFAGVYRATDFTVTGVPVPEPASIHLVLITLSALYMANGRRASHCSHAAAPRVD